MFGKLQSTDQTNTSGIGCGLVLTKLLASQFGGHVRVKSKPNIGSRFQASLIVNTSEARLRKYQKLETPPSRSMKRPRKKASSTFSNLLGMQAGLLGKVIVSSSENVVEKQAEIEQTTVRRCRHYLNKLSIHWTDCPTKELEKVDFNEKRILIVDDDPFNCLAIKELFKVLGLDRVAERVDECYGGQEALDKIRDSLVLAPPCRASTNLKPAGRKALKESAYGLILSDC